MNNFYLYKFDYLQIDAEDIEKTVSSTVIFCDRVGIEKNTLTEEIRKFYNKNYQTDKIVVIAGNYINDNTLREIFIDDIDETFIGIPRRQDTFLKENLHVLTFDKVGKLTQLFGENPIDDEFIETYLNEGLQNIFINRGGLVTSQGSHHFVFPSGKHCDKFLRTGNILLVSSEIYFIAFALLKHYDEAQHDQIYCDTSSINTIAFALTELKGRFLDPSVSKQLPIESFSSYEGLYKNDFSYNKNALLLISASTSSNIISYILDRHKQLDRCNIVILYYLGEKVNYSNVKDKVICNLTYSPSNLKGIPLYQVHKGDDCEHCKKGSYPVEISGDIFSLEKPRINRIILKVTDADKNLSPFVQQFLGKSSDTAVLKTHYKENSQNKYEVYIDFIRILNGLSDYKKYDKKLNAFINQYIPSNTKYILSLKDEGSVKLAEHIIDKISTNYNSGNLPKKLTFDELNLTENIEGAIVVVGSCISNGKALLFLSRALRKKFKLRIIYFIGITRTKTKQHSEFLKTNLKQGFYGPDTNSYIEIESMFCDNNSKTSSWILETEFLKDFIDFVNDNHAELSDVQAFLKKRKKMLDTCSGDSSRGMSLELFYPRATKVPFENLKIRKGFAFFKFDAYDEEVNQSDIYFTISKVLNDLRNSDDLQRNLKQTIFVRNVIDPGNFNRYNDGIIQASLLRAAKADELNYGIDSDISAEMTNILETIIKYHADEQGEALVEFLYAIATKKLTLRKNDLEHLVNLAKKCKENLIICFVDYISEYLIKNKEKNVLEPYDCSK